MTVLATVSKTGENREQHHNVSKNMPGRSERQS
jgi:hypothetical protein